MDLEKSLTNSEVDEFSDKLVAPFLILGSATLLYAFYKVFEKGAEMILPYIQSNNYFNF
jgi:hypothetical protein